MKNNNRFRNRNASNSRRNGSSGNFYPVNINVNTSLDSNGPCGKLKGNALQIMEKYLVAAKDANSSDDRVLYEICLQHSEHYFRLHMDAMINEENRRKNSQNTNNFNRGQNQNREDEAKTVPVGANVKEEGENVGVSSEIDESSDTEDNPDVLDVNIDFMKQDLSFPVIDNLNKPKKPRVNRKKKEDAEVAAG